MKTKTDRRPLTGLLVIAAAIALINAPFFIRPLYPVHDGMFVLTGIYHFYSQFFFHGQLAQWSPYSICGVPSSFFQINAFSPANYLVGMFAKVFQVRDAFLIYHLSIAIDELILAGGVFAFVRYTTKDRKAALLASLAAVLSCAPFYQPFFNLRFFYLMPWTLYFILKAVRKGRAGYLWLSLGLIALTSIGTAPYFMIPPLLASLLFYICLFPPAKLKAAVTLPLSPTRSNLAAFALLVISAALYFICLKEMAASASFEAIGRDVKGHLDINTFLAYGGHKSPADWLQCLLFRLPLFPSLYKDYTIYVGILPVILLIIALFRVRDRALAGIIITAGAILLISFEGIFQRLSYYLPLMSYYRHSAYLQVIVKILIIMGSGWGFAWALKKAGNGRHGENIILLLLSSALLLDLLSFQYAVYKEVAADASQDRDLYSAMYVQKPPYNERRTPAPANDRDCKALAIGTASRLKGLYFYASDYNFFQYEPCFQDSRNDWMSDGIRKLYRTPYVLTAVNGCGSPKLRLTTDVRYMSEEDFLLSARKKNDLLQKGTAAKDTQTLSEIGAVREDLARTLIITTSPQGSLPALRPADPAGEVKVEDFHLNALKLSADVTAPQGAWLYYADAFHPGWKAYVDNTPVDIHKAYAAFKAVFVPPGRHIVRFVYFNGLQTVLIIWVAIASAIAGLLLAITSLKTFCRPMPGTGTDDHRT